MPSAKALAVSTLRSLARRCLREQMQLKVIRGARRKMQADEATTLRRIKHLKARIDCELTTSAELLGLPPRIDPDS
jgi:hypothetical protein